MTYNFINAPHLTDAISAVSDELGFTMADTQIDCTITVSEIPADKLHVTLHENTATITYGGGTSRFLRALAILHQWMQSGETEKSTEESVTFPLCGAMVDMSRNAVMNVKTVKSMLRQMALMGMNCYMLYTEDTYEIENRPYFGYMRGRYTKAELKELDAYGGMLGIELIPCIQTLGHLATHLRWSDAGAYKDTANCLLVDSDATYGLIEDMFTTCAECFTTRRIHIGMDETNGLGTGAYLRRNGYRTEEELYQKHLHRVVDMAHSLGLEPMMWSDMLFQKPGNSPYREDYVLTEDTIAAFPEGVQPVFWDYYHPGEHFYAYNIESHKKLSDSILFGGGVWTWSGHCPQFSRSLRHTIPALDACRKGGIREVIATVWQNGGECSTVLSLAGLAWYADYAYRGAYSEEGVRFTFRAACGVAYDDILKTELPEYPHGGDVGFSRCLLYNDPLIGLMDAHIKGLDTISFYAGVTAQLRQVQVEDLFAPAVSVVRDLSVLLERKADFGVRLKEAYDANDRAMLAAMMAECDEIGTRISNLRESHRTAWMAYYKPFGWEVHDIRYGGLLMRFDTVKARIGAYLDGSIEHIEELEAERCRFDTNNPDLPRVTGGFLWYGYTSIATVSRL